MANVLAKIPKFIYKRTIVSVVVQGIIIGGVLGFITLLFIMHAYVTNVNGWITIFGCGEPGNSIFLRGACAIKFAGPINVPEEAMYWMRTGDGRGHLLSGGHNYVMHFPKGQLPPNRAFWSLTMYDAKNHFVPNSINRYNVSDRSGLTKNPDGSVDIYIQSSAPVGHESNWLPAPSGNFTLWLRAYLPGQAILNGKYRVPPIVEVK